MWAVLDVMRRQRRLKILDRNNEVRWELNPVGPLKEWIDERIPPVPPGTLCEAERCVQLRYCGQQVTKNLTCIGKPNHEGDCEYVGSPERRPLAESYVWVVTKGHVCFTYVCWDCCEQMSDYYELDVGDYPTTDAGYAIGPHPVHVTC